MQNEQDEIQKIVAVARRCARLILENGGETYRAEETAYRICSAYGLDETDVFAVPTAVLITVCDKGSIVNTAIKRIRNRTNNLTVIDRINDLSRRIADQKVSLAEAEEILSQIEKQKPEGKLLQSISAGMTSAFFALLFGGGIVEFTAALLCGMLVQSVAGLLKIADLYSFALSFIGGMLIGLFTAVFIRITGYGDMAKIIAGAMMPLLPGIVMTNAIRDTMHGDLLSGVARAGEALLISITLAFGAGAALKFFLLF